MKFGHRVQGKITGYDERGRGILELPHRKINGYQEGAGTVVIPFSADGDTVTANFLRRDHGLKIAKLESVEIPGPDRIAPRCAHAGTCGGCLWQHLAYDAQITIKKEMINRHFEQAGHAERIETVAPCPPGPNETTFRTFFRNRMDFAMGWNGEVGLKHYDAWNRYVDVKECWIASPDAARILAEVRAWMVQHELEPWDAKFHSGNIRYCVIREGKRTNQRLVILVAKDLTLIPDAARSDLTARLDTYATSLLLGEQSSITDLSLAQRFETLKGDPWIEEEVNNIRYRIHPNSFFQTNTVMAEVLQTHVLDLLNSSMDPPDAILDIAPEDDGFPHNPDSDPERHPPATSPTAESGGSMVDTNPKRLLDLYCGLGFFGIAAAKRFPNWTISGYEIDAEAISLASQNAAQNQVADRCTFEAGPAEDLRWKDWPADILILDPPRAGLHPRVLQAVLEKKPTEIIYISCNYKRFIEEWKTLKEAYSCTSLQAFDLFPHTPHVEVVVHLRKKP